MLYIRISQKYNNYHKWHIPTRRNYSRSLLLHSIMYTPYINVMMYN